ncbi:MAG: outer membrane beta-barrel protein [Verrucomicrobiota bacterium]|nr:outer membrane beta-barrel protein [Verrucomicrobiota bacterium]
MEHKIITLAAVSTASMLTGLPNATAQEKTAPVATPAPAARVTASSPSTGTPVTYQPAPGVEPEITGIAGLFKWGPIEGHPHLTYRFVYGDGIQARPGATYKTAINEFSPGIAFNLGDRWRLDYTPTLRFYSNDRFRDSTDHHVVFGGAVPYGDWVFGLQQSYAATSGTLVETARQTDQESFSTGLDASYRLGTRTSLDFGVNQHVRIASEYPDVWEWSTMEWIGYEFNKRLSGGLGVGAGYADVEYGTDMTYEQMQARVVWRPVDKVSFEAHGGPEVRQFLDSDLSDQVSPVFGGGVSYRPFDVTTLSMGFNRSVSASYFQNQVTEGTSVNAGLRQRLLGKVDLSVGGGYRWTDYKATVGQWRTDRSDDGGNVSVELGIGFLKRGRFAVFYHHSENSSSTRDYTYTSDQYGFMVSYRW